MLIDREQFLFALSDAMDLVGIDEIQHSKRLASMIWQCSTLLDSSNDRRRNLFHLALLHDCGVSCTETHRNLLQEMEWQHADMHCETGARRMKKYPCFLSFARPIRYHHTRWEQLEKIEMDQMTRENTNLIFLLDRVDYLLQVIPGTIPLQIKNQVRHRINSYRNTLFSPDLLDIFLEESSKEYFWCALLPGAINDFIASHRQKREMPAMPLNELRHCATLFADIVDAKSPHTARHSYGVAKLAFHLAHLAGLDNSTAIKMEIAGLLHDLGKLQIPDHILDSPEPLAPEGLAHMRHHSFTTYRILSTIEGIEDIAQWAGNHHEALNGEGYPFHKKADQLDLPSRIIAMADVFQALAQDRPYRRSLPLPDILRSLKKYCNQGRLDREILTLVEQHKEECYHLARLMNTQDTALFANEIELNGEAKLV